MSIAEKLTTVAQNQQKVYDAGYAAGQAVGGDTETAYNNGVTDGQKAEYNRFWDVFQQNGERTTYSYAFAGYGWTDENFKPKYDINTTSGSCTFRSTCITDLKGILERQGVKLNITSATTEYFASASSLTHCPELGVAFTNLGNAFNGCSDLVSIDKINMSTSASCSCSLAFRNCTALTEIRFNENISPTGLDLHWSPLSHDSLMSLINGLADKTGSTGTWQITLGSDNLAKLTDAEKAVATEKGWSLV